MLFNYLLAVRISETKVNDNNILFRSLSYLIVILRRTKV